MANKIPFFILACLISVASLTAQAAPLTVAVKESPPFSYQDDDRWEGISVALWRRLAEQMGREFRLQPHNSVSAMLAAVEQGQADVAIGAITVTADRERRLDFTQPMFRAGLGIATRSEPGGWLATLRSMFSWKFASAVLALGLVLMLVGALVWLFERDKNPENFGGSAARGIGNGFWWSAVTMTTVGYGDKAPVSFAGRALGLVWMFVSVITISGFTAAIASSVTVNQLNPQVNGVADLPRVRVAAVDDTSGSDWLTEKNIPYRSYASPEKALAAVEQGEMDALLYDAPLMRYLISQRQDNALLVLPEKVREESYAFTVRNGSALREELDQTLLETLSTDEWRQLVQHYLGS